MNQKASKVIHVASDDWNGIYVDGELEYEGHSIPVYVVLNMLGKYQLFSEEHKAYYIDATYIEENGNLPIYFENIPKEMLEL